MSKKYYYDPTEGTRVHPDPKAPRLPGRVVFRKCLKWSSLNRSFVLYTGRGPNGKTLAAVRQLVEEPDTRTIVSNCHLGIPYKKLRLGEVLDYKDCRILLDSGWTLFNTRQFTSKEDTLWRHFLSLGRKFNNQVILTGSEPRFFPRYLLNLVHTVFEPIHWFNQYGTPKLTLVKVVRKGRRVTREVYPTVNARKYYKLFNTMEIQPIEGWNHRR